MEVTCPHCGKVNLVAGYFEREARGRQHPEGNQVEVLYCGFCGRTFTPKPKEKADAGA